LSRFSAVGLQNARKYGTYDTYYNSGEGALNGAYGIAVAGNRDVLVVSVTEKCVV